MKKYLLFILLVSALALSGCSNLPESKAELKLSIGQKDYLLEIAKNQAQKEKGLMDRTSLADNEGMIFYFDKPDYLNFWMKNTLIPLQIIFVNGCEIVDIQEMTVETQPASPLKNYSSKKLADKAIELNPYSVAEQSIGERINDLCQ